jgi:hypothetical protein
MNELNQHKKSDSIKWIIAFVALILLAVSVVALGTQVFGEEVINKPTTVNAPETKTDETPVDPLVPIEPTDEIKLVSAFNIVNSDNMKLMAKAPASYAAKQTNTVELNATAYPIGSENGGFVWSAKWANPNSTFAKGKDVYNYIELEGDTGSGTQYVTALQPFGEQIIITVSTVFNPNAVATCTVDYSEKWAETQYLETYTDAFIQENSIYDGGMNWSVNAIKTGTKQELIDMYQNNDAIEFSYLKTDIYTMDMTQDDYRYTVTVSEEFYDALASVGIELEEWHSVTFDYSQDITPAMVLNSLCCGEIIPLSGGEVDYELINKFNEAIRLWEDSAIYIDVELISEFGVETFHFNLAFDEQTIGSITTNVELNETNIIF